LDPKIYLGARLSQVSRLGNIMFLRVPINRKCRGVSFFCTLARLRLQSNVAEASKTSSRAAEFEARNRLAKSVSPERSTRKRRWVCQNKRNIKPPLVADTLDSFLSVITFCLDTKSNKKVKAALRCMPAFQLLYGLSFGDNHYSFFLSLQCAGTAWAFASGCCFRPAIVFGSCAYQGSCVLPSGPKTP